jgi:putative transposase
VRAGGSGKRIGGDTDTAPGADPTLLYALREYERFYNLHRPHQGIANARPLAPLPKPITDPDRLTPLNVRRHDRLSGILREYEHAA